MTTLTERAAHDQWAAQYLCAVMRRDRKALILLTVDIDPCRRSAWGRLDAVAAAARDLIDELGSPDDAIAVLSERLLADALRDGAAPGEEVG